MFATDLFQQVYAPVIAAWSRALPAIEAEYARQLASMTTDAPADAINDAERELERLFILLRPHLDRWALGIEKWHRGKWRGAVLSATNVDLATLIGPDDVRQTVQATIDWNVSLVKDVSAQIRSRIANEVFTGMREVKPAREVAKAIREAVGMGRKRSLLVASDQLSKITSQLADERRREAGIDVWKWRHSGKLHPRAEHLARDGNYYSDTPGGAGAIVDGQTVASPPEDRPGQLPYCGCRSQSVIVWD